MHYFTSKVVEIEVFALRYFLSSLITLPIVQQDNFSPHADKTPAKDIRELLANLIISLLDRVKITGLHPVFFFNP